MNHIYSEEHKQYIKHHITGRHFPELTEMFNKHFGTNFEESAIKSLVYRLGLGNGIDAKFNKGYEPTQFKKGHVPANKGTHNGGWEPTQFKKGSIPANRLPIGSERVDSKDEYVYVKIQDGHLNKNWKQKHVLLWEEQNGPVPKGFVLIFGDGDNTNISLDNLILVSRGQLAVLNKHNLIQNDVELTKTAIMIADLKTQISRRNKSKRRNHEQTE